MTSGPRSRQGMRWIASSPKRCVGIDIGTTATGVGVAGTGAGAAAIGVGAAVIGAGAGITIGTAVTGNVGACWLTTSGCARPRACYPSPRRTNKKWPGHLARRQFALLPGHGDQGVTS